MSQCWNFKKHIRTNHEIGQFSGCSHHWMYCNVLTILLHGKKCTRFVECKHFFKVAQPLFTVTYAWKQTEWSRDLRNYNLWQVLKPLTFQTNVSEKTLCWKRLANTLKHIVIYFSVFQKLKNSETHLSWMPYPQCMVVVKSILSFSNLTSAWNTHG